MIVSFRGPCSTLTGWGKIFSNLAERLGERFPIEILPSDNHVDEGWKLPIEKVPKGKEFGVFFGPANKAGQLTTRYRVLYTMYEASDIPKSWKQEIKRVNEVWVPTKFCQDVFSHYNRTRIVRVGYDERAYHHAQWSRGDREDFWRDWCPEAVGKSVVGIAGTMSGRKGIDLLLKAWELAALEDAVLVVKTRQTRGKLETESSTVCILDEDWPEERMAQFYRSLDLFVGPSRGEGFGLCPLECVACGTPALVTRGSGPADYIDDRGVYGLDVFGSVPAQNMLGLPETALWLQPSGLDLVAKLKAWVHSPPPVEHQYRQWSMAELVKTWEAELHQARKRAGIA